MTNTAEAAQGRWRQILPALGIPAKFVNGRHQGCPLCGGKDRARFDDRHGQGDYICGQCGAGNGFSLLQKFHGWTFAQAASEVDRVLGNLPAERPKSPKRALMTQGDVVAVWQTGKPIQDSDYVATYLRSRAITGLAHWPVALRLIERNWHAPTRQYLPCMIAAFQGPHGAIETLHRTYLAKVTPNRMFLPCRIPIGGAIRLFEPAFEMGIAEGIETALSASVIFKMPVWATTSERLLREWQPPSRARRIWIFGDNDRNLIGQAAAYALGARLSRRDSYTVTMQIPREQDWDWNDILKEKTPDRDLPELRLQHRDIQSPRQPIPDAT